MDLIRSPALPKNAVRDQQKHFRKMGIPKEFSDHGVLVASVTEGALLRHRGHLQAANNLTIEDIQALTLLALYHPLPSLNGVVDPVRKRIEPHFERFHKYRELDEQDLPKNIDQYAKLIYPSDGIVDPVFIVRAMDLAQTHEFSAEALQRLYSYYGKKIDGAEIRRNICISMLDVYYPIGDALFFLDSERIRDIAAMEIWPDKFAKIKGECEAKKDELERSQSLLRRFLEAAVRRVALENSIQVLMNPDGAYIYTDRIKDPGSILLKLIKKELPTSTEYTNDMHGFLAVAKDVRHAMRLATQLMNELRKHLSSPLSIDPRYLAPPREDGTVHPSMALDFVGPVITKRGEVLSSFGAEVQITDLEGVRTCTQGPLIHGAHKQLGLFGSKRIITPETLPSLLEYRAKVNGNAHTLSELKAPDVESEYIQVSCTITGIQRAVNTTVTLKEGAKLIDLLAHLDLLKQRTFTTDAKTGKPILFGDEMDARVVRINVDPNGKGLEPPQADMWLSRTSDAVTITRLREIRNGYRKNGIGKK